MAVGCVFSQGEGLNMHLASFASSLTRERQWKFAFFAVEGMHAMQGWSILVDILKFERKFGIFSCIPLNFGPHYVHCNEDLNDVA